MKSPHISTIKLLAGSLALTFAVVACGGGGGSAVNALPQQAPTLPNSTPYTGPASLADFTWGKQALSEMAYQGPATFATLSVDVQVQMSNAPGLMRYAQSVSDPHNALYRRYLTPQQIGDEYGASISDYAKVENYFTKYGMNVGGWPQREMVTVTGTQKQLQAAFGTAFGTYSFDKTTLFAPTQTPHFSQVIPVSNVGGLIGYNPIRRDIIQGSGYANFRGYTPQQMSNGFDYSGAYGAGYTGAGITVGIIGTGPLANGSGGDTETYASTFGWKMATVNQVSAQPQAAGPVNGGTGTVLFDPNPGGLAPAPPATTNCQQGTIPNYTTCNPEDGEAQLDTEQVAGLAPGANVNFYLAYNPSECVNPNTGSVDPPATTNPLTCTAPDVVYPLEGIQLTDDEIQQAIADNTADALTLSFGAPENVESFFGYITGNPASPGNGEIEFASLAAEGIAVFVSSGDDGAWECFDPSSGAPTANPCVSYPASDPNVVGVGGVNAPFDNYGRLSGQILAWADETTLGGNSANCPGGQTFCNDVGSGGGVSTVEPAPAWQTANVPNLGTTMRAVPDISYMADPNTGPTLLMNAPFGAQIGASGGTSAAAPEAAAAWALVLQACKATPACATGSGPHPYRLGNPAPLLYAIYGGSYGASPPKGSPGAFTPHLSYSNTFYDVVYGYNGANGLPSPGPSPSPGASPGPSPTPIAIPGYVAGPGYDEVTGLGVPFVGHLIQAITGQVVP